MVTDKPHHLASELLPLFKRGGTRHFPEQGLGIGYPTPKRPQTNKSTKLETGKEYDLSKASTQSSRERHPGILLGLPSTTRVQWEIHHCHLYKLKGSSMFIGKSCPISRFNQRAHWSTPMLHSFLLIPTHARLASSSHSPKATSDV